MPKISMDSISIEYYPRNGYTLSWHSMYPRTYVGIRLRDAMSLYAEYVYSMARIDRAKELLA